MSLLRSMNHLYVPDGKTPDEMYAEDEAKFAGSGIQPGESPQDSSGFFPPEEDYAQPPRTEWRRVSRRVATLRAAAQESGRQAMARQILWPKSRAGDSWSPEPERLSKEEQVAWDRKVADELKQFMEQCSLEEKEAATSAELEREEHLAMREQKEASRKRGGKKVRPHEEDAEPDVPIISSAWPRI